jgi:hypothetical protein
VDGEPVEQFGMGGRFALGAEIFFGFDKPCAKDLSPVPVDGDAGG